MSFDKNYKLYISNEIEWTKVSLLKRIPFKMPTTTNSHESTHGHLNKKMPRRNNFWMSLFRIIRSLSFKNQSLNQMYRHNFYFTKHITLEKAQSTSQREMESMIAFYKTTIDHCECGENKLVSSIINVNIPCSHRCYLGCTFPLPNELIFSFEQQWKKLEVEYNLIEFDDEPFEKKYTKSLIKYFSYYMGKNSKEEISEYVEENFNNDDCSFYINCKKVTLVNLIIDGIDYFTKLKMKKEREKQKKI
ncbi:hypothetical protein M9Y10_008323 [Tritrichomonas musculus]|uniref:Uncharacterized protein n=1 Tax=Tritrichomonas musculus TaxID=1915356 RepID=A0ABR2IY53_9EUKA